MNQLFINTNDIYACSHAVAVRSHRVDYPDLETFHRALRNFERALGEDAGSDYWKTFVRLLRRYRFELSSCPLPPIYSGFDAARVLASLEVHLRQCHRLYQQHADGAHYVLDAAIRLSTLDTNPLLDAIVNTCGADDHQSALLIKEPRRRTATCEVLAGTPAASIKVLGIHLLREESTYDRLIVLGSSAWFPAWVFSAPRAQGMDYICCSWMSSDWRPDFAFASTQSLTLGKHTLGERSTSPSTGAPVVRQAVNDDTRLTAQEVLPAVDWDAISAQFERQSSPSSAHDDVVARLFLLEGDIAVFLEASDSAKVMGIDLEEEATDDGTNGRRFTWMLIHDIEPGIFVLLRASGGGDYLLPIADKFLGAGAERARERQRHWKSLLSDIATREGLLATSIRLLDLGAVRAEENNLRNWLSARNIRPHDKADFDAIMKLTGLESLIPEYWKNTKAIRSAHLRAGFQIRRLLLKQAKNIDFEELAKVGRVDIELPEAGAGSLSVFRVLAISEREYVVQVSQLGVPFQSGGLWQE